MPQTGTALQRTPVLYHHLLEGVADIVNTLHRRLEQKGMGSYASRHEILGMFEEELSEVKEAIRNDTPEGYDHFADELMDMAIVGLFGYICMKNYIRP